MNLSEYYEWLGDLRVGSVVKVRSLRLHAVMILQITDITKDSKLILKEYKSLDRRNYIFSSLTGKCKSSSDIGRITKPTPSDVTKVVLKALRFEIAIEVDQILALADSCKNVKTREDLLLRVQAMTASLTREFKERR